MLAVPLRSLNGEEGGLILLTLSRERARFCTHVAKLSKAPSATPYHPLLVHRVIGFIFLRLITRVYRGEKIDQLASLT